MTGAEAHTATGTTRTPDRSAASTIAAVALLDARIAALGDPTKRAWSERYLKGVLPFCGVGIPTIRAVVADWYAEQGRSAVDGDGLLAAATALMQRPVAEDKLAAILLLQEHGLDRLDPGRHLPTVADWFDDGHIVDWNTCDWLCVRVLGPLIERHGADTAALLARWVDAPGLWRRRAAGVAFVGLAPRGDAVFAGLATTVIATCERTVRDPQRFAQTGTGWVLRELSRAEPAVVCAFVDTHRSRFSREALRMATARLPEADRVRLLTADGPERTRRSPRARD